MLIIGYTFVLPNPKNVYWFYIISFVVNSYTAQFGRVLEHDHKNS